MEKNINEQIAEVLEKYPTLNFNKCKKYFYGTLNADIKDDYEVQIEINNFPHYFPIVRETGERIPKKADRHILQNHSICFTTPAKAQILLKTKAKTLLKFIDLILMPFLQNNSFYEINNCYMQGEYSHHLGILEGYFDILGIKKTNLVLQILYVHFHLRKKIRPNDDCYCGSKEKIKYCKNHCEMYKKFKLIDKQRMQLDFESIIQVLKNRY